MPIHLQQLMERYRERGKDLHMPLIDLETTYDKLPRDALRWILEKKGVPIKYINIIKNM